MSASTFHEWQDACLRALLEPLGSPTLPQRVKEAETAISRRIQELRASHDGNAERQELAEGLRSLGYVRKENFRFRPSVTQGKFATPRESNSIHPEVCEK
jgi:hypothetical protein